ncbi:MAG: hypothetical protein L6Q99_17565 [Planctomycetes bacterium]|nr:hypothetical protein [Planctomycetota bacterium]
MIERRAVLIGSGLAVTAVAVAVSLHAAAPTYQVPTALSFYSPAFRCPIGLDDDLANYVSWAVPEKRLVVGVQEKHPVSGEWARAEYVYSTSYQLLDVAFRLAGQELYISGVQVERSTYTDVIERWTFPAETGGYTGSVGGGATGTGVPRAAFAGYASISGGTYLPPNIRNTTRQPVPNKTVLYAAPAGGHFNCIAADPEGRQLFLHNYTTGDVLALDLLVEDAVPQILFSGTQNPTLAGARTMVLHDVPNVGRICRLTAEDRHGAYPSGSNQTAILIDPENDAMFDSLAVHSAVDLARGLTPFGNPKNWLSTANFGWDSETEFQ